MALAPYFSETPVPAIELGPLYAAGGDATIDAGNLHGTGTIDAYGAPTISVTNESPDYLILNGTVTIPYLPTGHIVFSGAAQGASGIAATGHDADVGGQVTITDTYGSQYGTPPNGPAIIVNDEISNLGGSVLLNNDEGSVIEAAAVYGEQVNLNAPKGAAGITDPNATYYTGGNPISEWQNFLTYPGGDPHTTVGSLDVNAAIAYVADSEHSAGSVSALMADLIGPQGGVIWGDGYNTPTEDYLGSCVPAGDNSLGNCDGGNADTLSSEAGGNGGNTSDNNGDPLANLPVNSLVITTNNFGLANATGSDASGLNSGGLVIIDVKVADIDAPVVAGPPTDWSVYMPSNLTVSISALGVSTPVSLQMYQQLYQAGLVSNPVINLPVTTLLAGDALITATFDARTGQISLSDVKASAGGGLIKVEGEIVSTNPDGELKVNGGLGQVTVDNETGVDLAVNNIYTGSIASNQAATSHIQLIDDLAGEQTLYSFNPGQGTEVYQSSDLSASISDLEATTPVGSFDTSGTYTPTPGYRLEWSLQADLSRTEDSSNGGWVVGNWVFDNDHDDPNNPWGFQQYTDNVAGSYGGADDPSSGLVYAPGGPLFEETITANASGGQDWAVYNYDCGDNIGDGCDNGFLESTHDDPINHENAGEWDYYFPANATITLNMSVAADQPIAIDFGGHDTGLISITSNSNIYLDGTLTNPNGNTTIVSTNGSIFQGPSPASTTTDNLTLQATGGVGTSSHPIKAALTGGELDATSGSAGVYVDLGSGARIGSISAGNSSGYGDVVIEATGALVRAQGSGSSTTNVSGRNITLNTSIGSIGSISNPMIIAAHATALANGGFSNGFVDVHGVGDVGLKQTSGDLVVNEISSDTGNVSIDVTDGGIYDERSQTPAQSLSETSATLLWTRLSLTTSFGIGSDTLANQSVVTYEQQIDQAYNQYWQLRDDATDYDSMGNPTTTHYTSDALTLTTNGISNLRQAASQALGHFASDAEVQTYAQSLYTADAALFDGNDCSLDAQSVQHCVPGIDPSWRTEADFVTFNPSFSYTATATQTTNLTQNSTWTEDELRYAINATALEPGGTSIAETTPNISGNNVTLHSTGSIGRLASPESISLSDLQSGNLTSDQQTALSLASAPGDVTLVAEDGMGHTVDFTFGSTIPAGYTLTGILVKQTAPLFVEADGVFNATSDNGSVYVQSTVPDLTVGSVSAGTNASLVTAQSIVSAGTSAPQVTTGGDLTLVAGAGVIAATDAGNSPFEIVVGGQLISAGAGGNVDLEATSGDLDYQRISAGGDVTLSVDHGSLLQTVSGPGIGGDNLTAYASNSIGKSSQYVTLLIGSSGTVDALALNGNIWIDEAAGAGNANGDLNIASAAAFNGNVNLMADGSIFNVGGGPSGSASVLGNSIDLVANGGSIGTLGHDVDIDSQFSGSGSVSASSSDADTRIIETSGDLALGSIVVTGVSGQTAYLVAENGSILNDAGVNVEAPKAYLSASHAIGSSGNPVTTEVTELDAHAAGGGIWILQTGAVSIGNVLTNTGATPPHGIDATGPISLTTGYDGSDDDIELLPAVQIVSTGSSVTLDSGRNIFLDPGSSVQAATSVALHSDFGDAGGQPTTIFMQGALSAGTTGTVTGGNGADTITFQVSAIAGHWEVFGGGGPDTITVDQLPSLDLADECSTDPCTTAASLNTGTPGGPRDTLDLDGQGGGDAYIININGSSDYIINVHDTGAENDGADIMTINGTPGDDTFLLRPNFVAWMPSPDTTDPSENVERINYDDTINLLQVNGGDGDDGFYVDGNSAITVLDGGAGQDTFQFGQIFGADREPPDVAPGDEIPTVDTTVGWLSVGPTYATTAYGGDDDDTFTVYSNKAPLKLFGEDGNDTFVVRAFLILNTNQVATGDTLINGGDGDDHIEYNINAPVSIDGGAGVDTVVVIGTEADDNFVITNAGVLGAGLNVSYTNVERLEVDGLEGDDNFYVLSTPPGLVVTLVGGTGNDTFNVGDDVTTPIIAESSNGESGFINHSLTSTDPDFNDAFAPGVPLSVAGANSGTVEITQTSGSTVVYEDGVGGPATDSYTIQMTATPTSPTTAYLTVAATLDPSKYLALGGGSIELSVDGGLTWSQAVVLTFTWNTAADNAAWQAPRLVLVRAVSDDVPEGQIVSVVSGSIQSNNPEFDNLVISNVETTVIDDDQPGLIVKQPVGGTTVIDGGSGASLTVSLTHAPDPGETVTVAFDVDPTLLNPISSITFDDSDWNTPQTVSVSALNDGLPHNELIGLITPVITSTGGLYANLGAQQPVSATILNAYVGGLIVVQSNGNTVVSQGHPDTYTIQLTKLPTADVTVQFLTDGKTIVSGGPDAYGRQITTVGDVTSVTFSPSNWNDPFTVIVSVNPNAPADEGNQPVQEFPAQPHTLDQIQGPVLIEGNEIEDRALVPGVRLPTETDVPLPVPTEVNDLATATDTLNVYDDGSVSPETGTLGAVPDIGGIQEVYTAANQPFDPTTFGLISGLGMGGPLTVDFGESGAHDYETFDGGITYHNIAVVNVMLGQANDTFTVTGTTPGSITVVQGGGGDDHLIATGGGGPDSPLILFGDTSQDGSFYNSTTADLTGNAREFTNFGNDVIDASADPNSVAAYGGPGNDTIYGGAGGAGDLLAGGSGDDLIVGGSGNDQIYGDDGFNLDLSKRVSLSTQIVTVANSPSPGDSPTGDPLTAGNDTLDGGAGDDILIGDHGVITQTPGTNRILDTGDITSVYSVLTNQGGNDTIDGGPGNDVAIGGYGSDTLYMGAGNNVSFGDNGLVDFVPSTQGITFAETLDPVNGSSDYIDATGTGINVAFGGPGADQILLGNGTNTVFGDDGEATFDPTTDIPIEAQTTDPGVGADDFIDAEGNSSSIDVAFGGPGTDTINLGDGTNTAFGDDGEVQFYATGIPKMAESIDLADGAHDVITAGGDGVDVAFGGAGDDSITTGAGTNTVFGDTGYADFGPNGVPTQAGTLLGYTTVTNPDGSTTSTPIGGVDTIQADGTFETVVFGGPDGDLINGGSGHNTIFGDDGVANFVNGIVSSAETTDPGIGGDDSIMLGSNATCIPGDDQSVLSTGSPIDVVFGGPGNDCIESGNGTNTIFGDDGEATFDTTTGIPTEAHTTNGSADGGVTQGDGGNDYIVAQSTGQTVVFGGPGSDTIIGGAGNNDIWGDDGDAELVQGTGVVYHAETTNPGDGATDYISTTGESADVIFGGPGGDVITAGSGNNDVVFGDDGEADFDPTTGVLSHGVTTNPSDGGNDQILTTGTGINVIVGGTGSDQITLSGTRNIVFGDDAQVDPILTNGILSAYADILPIDPLDGAADNITVTCDGANCNNYIVGETGSDVITSNGAANDLIFGDFGEFVGTIPLQLVVPTGPVPFAYTSVYTSNAYVPSGADDVIHAGDGRNIVIGGQGDDLIVSGSGDDDLIGGSNVAGADDGSDTIDGGAGNDDICGDNCSILPLGNTISLRDRTLTWPTIYSEVVNADGTYEYVPNISGPVADPDGILSRSIVLFDYGTTDSSLYGDDYIAGGPGDDMIFGEQGDDTLQGDGSITIDVGTLANPGTSVPDFAGPGTDGNDYIEGGPGDDLIYGDLGQDDIIGGSSSLYLPAGAPRPDGGDVIFGEAGTEIGIDDMGDTSPNGHASDADVILGDNGNIYDLTDPTTGQFLTYAYDSYPGQTEHVIPRAIALLDYSPVGDTSYVDDQVGLPIQGVVITDDPLAGTNIGGADLIYGENGDDVVYGETGDDTLFGGAGDDILIGNSGDDWIDGGTGDDAILGDDGLVMPYRNGTAETLFGIAATENFTMLDPPGPTDDSAITVWPNGAKNYAVDLNPFFTGGNDILYGGLGNDFIHGGAGDDAISGADPLPIYYGTPSDPPLAVIASMSEAYVYGNVLSFDPGTQTFRYYNPDDPFSEIMVLGPGQTPVDFLLNFNAGPITNVIDDGQDALFGDEGNDWIVGGTNTDYLFGGDGDDLLQGDDYLQSTAVTTTVTYASLCSQTQSFSSSSWTASSLCNTLTQAQATSSLSYRASLLQSYSNAVLNDIGPVFTGNEAEILTNEVQSLMGTSPLANDIPDPRSAGVSFADILVGGPGSDIMIANTTSDRLYDWSAGTDTFVIPWGGQGGPFWGPPFFVDGSGDPIDSYLQVLAWSLGADDSPAPFDGWVFGDDGETGLPCGPWWGSGPWPGFFDTPGPSNSCIPPNPGPNTVITNPGADDSGSLGFPVSATAPYAFGWHSPPYVFPASTPEPFPFLDSTGSVDGTLFGVIDPWGPGWPVFPLAPGCYLPPDWTPADPLPHGCTANPVFNGWVPGTTLPAGALATIPRGWAVGMPVIAGWTLPSTWTDAQPLPANWQPLSKWAPGDPLELGTTLPVNWQFVVSPCGSGLCWGGNNPWPWGFGDPWGPGGPWGGVLWPFGSTIGAPSGPTTTDFEIPKNSAFYPSSTPPAGWVAPAGWNSNWPWWWTELWPGWTPPSYCSVPKGYDASDPIPGSCLQQPLPGHPGTFTVVSIDGQKWMIYNGGFPSGPFSFTWPIPPGCTVPASWDPGDALPAVCTPAGWPAIPTPPPWPYWYPPYSPPPPPAPPAWPSVPTITSSPTIASAGLPMVISGQGVAGDTLMLFDGTTKIGSVLVGSNGLWSLTIALGVGAHTLLTFEVNPANGFASGASTSTVVTTFTPPPPPAITGNTTPGPTTKTASVKVSGTGVAGDTVTLYDGGVALCSTTVASNGTWSVTVSLGVGAHPLTATQLQMAYVPSAASPTVTVNVYPPTPVPSITTSPPNATAGAPFTLSGNGVAGDTITVSDGSTVLGTTTVLAGGTWSFSATLTSTGKHTLTATQTDPVSTFASSPTGNVYVQVYTQPAPPVVKTVSSPAPTLSTSPFTVTGTGVAGETITLYDGGVAVGSATVSYNGSWSITASLAPGTHVLTATQTVAAGVTSVVASVGTVTVLRLPPAPAITTSGANETSGAAFTLSGTGVAGDSIEVLDGSTQIGSATVGPNGTWSTSITLTTTGKHTLTAVQVDSSSLLTGAASGGVAFQVYNQPATPVIKTVSSPAPTLTTSPFTVTGTGASGDTVTLADGGVAVGSATVASNGNWSITVSLAPGTHVLTATQTVATGVTSVAASVGTVTVLRLPPAPAITSSAANETSGAAFTLSGTGVAGDSIKLFDGSTQIGTATVLANGTWSTPVTLTTTGKHTLTAVQVDASSLLTGAPSAGVSFQVYAQPGPPVISTVSTPAATKTTTQVTVTGTGASGDTITLYDGTTSIATVTVASNGTWSLKVSLGVGAHSLSATQSVAAGVTSTSSNVVTVTVPQAH
jgi:Ca2+-binding RTX toxin-like protein